MSRLSLAAVAFLSLPHLGAAPMLKDRVVTHLEFPKAVGTKWVYSCSHGIDNYELECTITKSEEKGGDWVITYERRFHCKSDVETIVNSRKGIYVVRSPGLRNETNVWLMRLPAKPGLSWEWPGQPDVTFEIIGEDEVVIPAGKFRAVRVDQVFEELGRKHRSSTWYASEVGPVKSTSAGGFSKVLKSFAPVEK